MVVLTRYRVAQPDREAFAAQAESALRVLSGRAGYAGGEVGQNVDDPELWCLTTRWDDVGSYRRALSGTESKMVVVPLLSRAVDEPTAYQVVVAAPPAASLR
ncbi:MAG: antibiotic biosynthesis monooxygenase family protein [Nocardioidaceae bacterium]|nr:antibiotic biosynthesis monooxygenase family protein [Nocardioidaceae bacterium]